jgi:uridine kinase
MYEQLKALKEGKTVAKPIYNHVNGYGISKDTHSVL